MNPNSWILLCVLVGYLVIVLSVSSVRSEKRGPVACSSAAEEAALTCDSRDSLEYKSDMTSGSMD